MNDTINVKKILIYLDYIHKFFEKTKKLRTFINF